VLQIVLSGPGTAHKKSQAAQTALSACKGGLTWAEQSWNESNKGGLKCYQYETDELGRKMLSNLLGGKAM
jgi:hypothetical protein